MEMVQKGDEKHRRAMQEMGELIKTSDGMKEWFEQKRKEFDRLPETE